MSIFDGLEVFSATMQRDRTVLGERVTEWIIANPQLDVIDYDVVQSSDDQFHCITIVLYFKNRSIAAATGGAGKPRVAAGGARR